MDRNREARRGTMAAVNGGLSRRRQRSNSLRDSPDEDGALEMQETGRLRDRGGKKDRDRDRSNRNKRRRGERILHGGNREEGEDSSEESVDDEEEDDDDEPGAPEPVRLPPPPPVLPNPSPASSSLPPNHHHRKSFPAKVVRAPALWKVTDEMIGVSVPRKARSSTASSKRSHECWVSGSGAAGGGGGGGGGVSGSGEPMNHHRQTSTSPARLSPASTAPISPSSSNASVRRKMKPISGTKHRPPKITKSPSSVQDIEFEVAEVLFGMTRQFQGPSKQEVQRPETKEANGSSNEAKSRVSSPNSTSQPPTASPSSALPPPNSSSTGALLPAVVAPKRKRPRPVSNIEEGSSTHQPNQVATPSATTSKVDGEQTAKMEAPSPKLEKNTPSTMMENGSASHDLSLPQNSMVVPRDAQESTKPEAISDSKPLVPEVARCDTTESKEVASSPSKKGHEVELDANRLEPPPKKAATLTDSSKGEKFKIDLMAPPPAKSSPEAEALTDFSTDRKPMTADDTGKRSEIGKMEEERLERTPKPETVESLGEVKMVEKGSLQEFESKESVPKERTLDLQLDIEKTDEDVLSSSRQQAQKQQQSKIPKSEKGQPASIPLPMGVAGWPGGLPPIGYMGQVPSLQAAFPMDGSNGGSKAMQAPQFPPPWTKRCATHCYIAQNVYYHQQLVRMNPFWAAPPGGGPLFGAKPYNLNAVPPSESILVNPLQGGFPGRSLGTMPDKADPVAAAFGGHSSKDKNSVANNFLDAQQRKPLGIQQPPQGASTSNMLHAPAFIFPLSQQHAAAAAATAQSGAVKPSGAGAGNAPPLSNASNSVPVASGTSAASAPTVSFNYTNLPANEAQYLAILQNNGYSFPIPAHVGAAPQYRGNHAQAMPFFNGPFYTSQMLHPSQLQQQAQTQQAHPSQPGHQNTSNSSGSTSSQKHPQQQQQQRIAGATVGSTGGASHGLPASKPRQHLPTHAARQLDGEAAGEENPSTADSRVSHVQKGGGMYAPNFTMSLNPQEYAMMAHAAAMGSGGGHTDKHHPAVSQQHNMKIDLSQSQPFAMSFATFNGAAAAAVPPPGLDFSSIAQSHLFQSVPEAARHSYQMAAAAAAAAQHKKAHHTEDGKAATSDSLNANVAGEDERKMVSSGKAPGGFSQHSLSFSRPDGDAPMATILSNSVIDSSRTLNLIPASVNGNRPSSAAPSSAGVISSNASHSNLNQHQQHLMQMQLRKQQQQHQQVQMQQQLAPRSKPVTSSNNTNIYSDRLPSGPVVTKFPNAIGGFPQALIQGSAPNQTSQWKNSAQTTTGVPSPSAKNQLPQQQGRSSQPALSGHQMQISFTSSSQKVPSSGQQLAGLSNSTSPASAAVVGSPQPSVSKSAGGSPRSSSGSKVGPPATSLPLQQQQPPTKGSPSGSSRKSSPVSSRNVPSILGNQHMAASGQNSSTKTQHHQQQQQLQKHPFPQPQLFFSNPYLPVQSPQANAAAGYYQRRPSEQQQQPNSMSSSTSVLSLCQPMLTLTGANATSDPAKAVAAAAAAAANSMKGLPPSSLLQSAQLAAAAHGGAHPLMSAPGFPYIHAMPSMSVKQAEQKPGAGNDNLHACWQPEKR